MGNRQNGKGLRPYSVLMSLYFKEKPAYFQDAMESMLHQTVLPDEIVLVKDGPLTEELDQLIDGYVEMYPEIIRILPLETNHGLGVALRIGLKECRNELVARMDTDDIAALDRCEKQLAIFESDPAVGVVGGHITEFIGEEENLVAKRRVPEQNEEIHAYMKSRNPFNHMTVMFKKSEVEQAGSYLDWFWIEDYYLWIRMMENGSKFYNLQSVLVKVRVGSDMYKRRGGMRYFKSQARLFWYMRKAGLIGPIMFYRNLLVRFTVQILMPNWLRGKALRRFARSSV